MNEVRILIAGEGGQGVQSIAEILALAANEQGKFVTYIPQFGVEQRGGVSIAFVQIADQQISYPRFDKAGIIIAMCNRAIEPIKKFFSDETVFIYDQSFIEENYLKQLNDVVKRFIPVPAKEKVKDISLKVSNIVFLGAIATQINNLNPEQIISSMNKKFSSHPEFQEMNEKAFRIGLMFNNVQAGIPSGAKSVQIEKKSEDDKKVWERFPEYCKGCGLCIVTCPVKALSFSKELNFLGTNLPQVDIAKCEACLTCQHICPDGAIRVQPK